VVRAVHETLRFLTVGGFAFSAALKMLGGIPLNITIPYALVVSAIVGEALIILAVLLGLELLAASLAIVIALGGFLIMGLARGRCGCFGPLNLSSSTHMMLASALGAVACAYGYSTILLRKRAP
jgi:hypothetical protein